MISVCLTVFEGELFLEEQISSILIQLSAEDELIISDDSLSSKSKNIVEMINDNRIVLIEGPKKGVGMNFEHALKKASGDFIFLSDQDDVWLPNKVELCLSALSKHDLVLTNSIVVDKDLKHIKNLFKGHVNLDSVLRILVTNKYIGSCMAFRKCVLEYAIPFPKYISMHDWWIGISVMIRGSVYYESEPLMLYRRHENNITNTGNDSKNSFFKKIHFRLGMLHAIYCLIFKNMKNK